MFVHLSLHICHMINTRRHSPDKSLLGRACYCFLDAPLHFYKRVCPQVGTSVCLLVTREFLDAVSIDYCFLLISSSLIFYLVWKEDVLFIFWPCYISKLQTCDSTMTCYPISPLVCWCMSVSQLVYKYNIIEMQFFYFYFYLKALQVVIRYAIVNYCCIVVCNTLTLPLPNLSRLLPCVRLDFYSTTIEFGI